MRKLNDYLGLVCLLCVLIVGVISYRADLNHNEKIEAITIYYDAELSKCDSVNELNKQWFVQDSIWHEAYKKIKH